MESPDTLTMIYCRMSFEDWEKSFDIIEIVHMGPKSFARLGYPEVCSVFSTVNRNTPVCIVETLLRSVAQYTLCVFNFTGMCPVA